MTFRLTWKPDAGQPLPVGQASHDDPSFQANLDKLQAIGAAVPNPIVEVNGTLDLRPFCGPIDNQGQISDCVADGTCSALEFCEIRNGRPFVQKSRLFIYYNARLQTRETDKDEGTYVRLAFATLSSLGTCVETTWPYDAMQVFIRPSWAAYREAYAHKIASFYRIEDDYGPSLVASIKQALQSQHPVVFGMKVDDDYQRVGSDGRVAMPAANRLNPGGHCQLIVGYIDSIQCWIVKNSWGTRWGDKGYAYVPYSYLDVSSASDFWVPTA